MDASQKYAGGVKKAPEGACDSLWRQREARTETHFHIFIPLSLAAFLSPSLQILRGRQVFPQEQHDPVPAGLRRRPPSQRRRRDAALVRRWESNSPVSAGSSVKAAPASSFSGMTKSSLESGGGSRRHGAAAAPYFRTRSHRYVWRLQIMMPTPPDKNITNGFAVKKIFLKNKQTKKSTS